MSDLDAFKQGLGALGILAQRVQCEAKSVPRQSLSRVSLNNGLISLCGLVPLLCPIERLCRLRWRLGPGCVEPEYEKSKGDARANKNSYLHGVNVPGSAKVLRDGLHAIFALALNELNRG